MKKFLLTTIVFIEYYIEIKKSNNAFNSNIKKMLFIKYIFFLIFPFYKLNNDINNWVYNTTSLTTSLIGYVYKVI